MVELLTLAGAAGLLAVAAVAASVSAALGAGAAGQAAAFTIAAGVSLFELARFMGTSVDQIDKTYGHLLPDALERTRQALDAFVAPRGEAVLSRGSSPA